MAGDGLRVQAGDSGPTLFKPFFEINHMPLYEIALSSLRDFVIAQVVWVVRADQVAKFAIRKRAERLGFTLCVLPEKTTGPLDTVFQGLSQCQVSGPGVVLDCDLYFKSQEFVDFNENRSSSSDAALLFFKADRPSYSYIRTDANDPSVVCEIQEKIVISQKAVCGCYYLSDLQMIAKYAGAMLQKRPHSEWYMSHLYQALIADGKKVTAMAVDEHLSLGTSDEIADYLRRKQGGKN